MNIIFDFDGTIADSFPFALQTIAKAARKPLPNEADELALRGITMLAMARRYGVGWLRLPGLYLGSRVDVVGHLQHVKLYAGMAELIKALHANGHQLYILSSNSPQTIRACLKQAGVEHCFTDIYGRVSIFGKAPMLKRLMRTHKLSKGKTIYIGDEARDLEATNAIGLRAIAVTWGFASRNHLEAHKPWAMVNSVADLAATISKV